jgi:hypothetical protein
MSDWKEIRAKRIAQNPGLEDEIAAEHETLIFSERLRRAMEDPEFREEFERHAREIIEQMPAHLKEKMLNIQRRKDEEDEEVERND